MILTFERTSVGIRITSNEPVSEELLAMAGSSRLIAARMHLDTTASFSAQLVGGTLEIGDRQV